MTEVVFATRAAAGATQQEALLLVRSIRQCGGAFAQNRVIIAVPDSAPLAEVVLSQLTALNAEILPFSVSTDVLQFPFGTKVMAAAAVEHSISDTADVLLVWMDSDCLVIQSPDIFLLDQPFDLAYRPVDHTLIGSRYDQPVDDFWRLIYTHFELDSTTLRPMITSVDQLTIRPYFNAGLLVIRPDKCVLRQWADAFLSLYADSRFIPFYETNDLYRIFMHQAVLSGVILSMIPVNAMRLLPHTVHYPLHMHTQYPAPQRVEYLNELITCRLDTFFNDANWRTVISIKQPLSGWLEQYTSDL